MAQVRGGELKILTTNSTAVALAETLIVLAYQGDFW
jgi:hypothetical protein